MVKIGKLFYLWVFVELVNMDMDGPIKKNSRVSKIWGKIEKFYFIVKESLCDSFGDFGD